MQIGIDFIKLTIERKLSPNMRAPIIKTNKLLPILLLFSLFCGCAITSDGEETFTHIEVPPLSETISSDETSKEVIPPETEQESVEKRFTFLAAGDNIIHSAIYEDALARATADSPKYNFLPMYDGISDFIASADITFINQETVMAGEEYGISGYPNFNSPQEAGDALVELGFDIVNIANNHMLDKKEAGFAATMEYWKTKPVLLIGAYESQEDYDDIRIFEYEGIKIAFLSYTYGTNGMYLNSGSKRVIPWINDEDIIRQCAIAKEKADLVFASIHWGIENSSTVSADQKRIAQLFCDNGVDVIIGHHPHVVQAMEWLSSDISGKNTLCIYSLGNLINTMYNSYNMVGGMVTFEIVQSPNGELHIENPIFNPTMCHYSMNRDGLQMYMLEDYTEELAKKHGSQLHGAFTLDTLKEYITKNIAEEFLPTYLK